MSVGNDSINRNDPSGTDAFCSLVEDVAEDVLRVVDKFLTAIAEPVGPILSNMAGSMDATVAQDPTKDAYVAGSFLSAAFPSFRTGSLGTAVEYLLHPDNALEFAAGINELSQGASGPSMRQNGLQEIEQTFQ